jgi:eukaryotic-like serine/threonine-protein kinase
MTSEDNKTSSDKTNVNTGGGDYAGGNIDKRQGGVFVEDSTIYRDVIGQQTIYYQPATTPLDRQQQRNRSRMLHKVETFWVKGVLENSLYGAALIELGMEYKPDAVTHPWDVIIQQLDRPKETLPPGKKLSGVFDEFGGELLILGAPGSGKTTMLLELARDLIIRAEQDGSLPIPVVFNLSSWAEKHPSLADWLIDELNIRYDVPRKLGTAWIDSDHVLPLLDGLDEVILEQRPACIAAINSFRQAHGFISLVVCSRVGDYEALSTRLKLRGAVLIQPLTAQKIDDYLAEVGAPAAGLQRLLHQDHVLREFAEAPLVLSTMLLAYQGQSVEAIAAGGTVEQQRRRLFDAYVGRMLARRGVDHSYSAERTRLWLGWLAQRMAEHAQTMFLIERLQPEWLPERTARLRYTLLDRLGSALAIGLLSAAIVWMLGYAGAAVLTYSVAVALIVGLFGGMGVFLDTQQSLIRFVLRGMLGALLGFVVVGLLISIVDRSVAVGLAGGFIGGVPTGIAAALFGMPSLTPRRIVIVETLRWSWSRARRLALGAFLFGAINGGIASLMGLPLGMVHGRLGLLYIVSAVLASASGAALAGIVLGGMVGDQLDVQTRPNQGIRRSARSALRVWLVFGLTAAPMGAFLSVLITTMLANDVNLRADVFFWIGSIVSSALVAWVVVGIIGALGFGGYAVLSHIALRLILWRSGAAPLDYVRFLDYCVERIFLRKVGGGYIFVHRLLMEHFASLQEKLVEE